MHASNQKTTSSMTASLSKTAMFPTLKRLKEAFRNPLATHLSRPLTHSNSLWSNQFVSNNSISDTPPDLSLHSGVTIENCMIYPITHPLTAPLHKVAVESI